MGVPGSSRPGPNPRCAGSVAGRRACDGFLTRHAKGRDLGRAPLSRARTISGFSQGHRARALTRHRPRQTRLRESRVPGGAVTPTIALTLDAHTAPDDIPQRWGTRAFVLEWAWLAARFRGVRSRRLGKTGREVSEIGFGAKSAGLSRDMGGTWRCASRREVDAEPLDLDVAGLNDAG